MALGTWRTVALLCGVVGGLSVGNILFRVGMTPAASSAHSAGFRALAMAGGMVLMIGQQCGVWAALRTWPASVVIPATGLNFAVLPLLEYWWLGEPMRLDRWLGIVCIVVGVTLVGRSAGVS
ncbi:MAG: EamA family transporter [Fimbriimonadaceae bacterium]|nr:EamA family transporter [Fimbriimonadaceae bacterium]